MGTVAGRCVWAVDRGKDGEDRALDAPSLVANTASLPADCNDGPGDDDAQGLQLELRMLSPAGCTDEEGVAQELQSELWVPLAMPLPLTLKLLSVLLLSLSAASLEQTGRPEQAAPVGNCILLPLPLLLSLTLSSPPLMSSLLLLLLWRLLTMLHASDVPHAEQGAASLLPVLLQSLLLLPSLTPPPPASVLYA